MCYLSWPVDLYLKSCNFLICLYKESNQKLKAISSILLVLLETEPELFVGLPYLHFWFSYLWAAEAFSQTVVLLIYFSCG